MQSSFWQDPPDPRCCCSDWTWQVKVGVTSSLLPPPSSLDHEPTNYPDWWPHINIYIYKNHFTAQWEVDNCWLDNYSEWKVFCKLFLLFTRLTHTLCRLFSWKLESHESLLTSFMQLTTHNSQRTIFLDFRCS